MESEKEKPSAVVVMLATILIGAGLWIILFWISEMHAVYCAPTTNHFINALGAAFTKAAIYSEPGKEPMRVEAAAAQTIGLLFFLVFAFFGAVIGLGVTRLGVHLLSPQAAYEFLRLKRRIDASVDSIKESIKSARHNG